MDKVIIDRETMNALSVDTRADIIKLLQQRNHTQSEIASSLNLAVPTIKQHLEVLEKADLVEKKDEGRKWKYYSLTKKAKSIFAPEEKSIWLILTVLALGILGSIAGLFKQLFSSSYAPQLKAASAEMMVSADAVQQAVSSSYWWVLYGGVIVILSILFLYYWRKLK